MKEIFEYFKNFKIKHSMDESKDIPLVPDSMIINLTHNDMDGSGSHIVLKNYFNNVSMRECKYTNIDDTVRSIKERKSLGKLDWLIITDISVSDLSILDGLNYVILDHHESADKIHDPSKNSFVFSKHGVSGTLLTYMFCRTLFGVPKYDIDQLVQIINDYDLWILKNKNSINLNRLFFKLFGKNFVERFTEGFTKFTKDEKEFLELEQQNYEKTYKELDMMSLQSLGVNGIFTVCENYISEICDRIIKEEKVELVLMQNSRNKLVSVRSSRESEINVGKCLETLEIGGGHKKAGGFSYRDFNDLQNKINNICNSLGR